MTVYNLISFAGLFGLIAMAWLFSSDRKKVDFRTVAWGVLIQLAVGCFIFMFPPGTKLFLLLNDFVVRVLDCAGAGSRFVFGRLALGPGQINSSGESSLGFILAFQGFPAIIFFSSLVSVLYFSGVMQKVIKWFARIFSGTMKVSAAESMVCASNIFVGIESAFTVRPFLSSMTDSEMLTVLTAGMATVASNILALYVFSLQSVFPTIAAHLISASLLSAPAAIVISKVLLPETGTPVTSGVDINPHYERENTIFEAIINGANAGIRMIAGIVALLIAVLGLVALTDMFLSGISYCLGALFSINIDFSLRGIFSVLFYPVTFMLGIPSQDAALVSRLIGARTVLTEVVAYKELAAMLSQGAFVSPRSPVICAYALCGFAHFASVAIFAGGISAIAPSRTKVIAKLSMRALLAATLACLMTAAVAGVFFTQNSPLFLLK